jgi:WD40 repeat protein
MKAIEAQLDIPFYVTGGTLSLDALCYVTRQSDHQLYDSLRQGQFCYVLTARQMGKSSLMVRTASRLRNEGIGVVVLDLTATGQNLTPEQWYDGMLAQMGQQLDLEDELEAFWDNHAKLGPLQRWMQALTQVALPHCTGRAVIFIDEIDAVRSLPFSTDEFFASIRELYPRRSAEPKLAHVSFCLLGVATPSDLIRDTRMTPFNIGERIELDDFTEAEAGVLAYGLGTGEGAELLRRILYWTGGHPYLTQRLCQAVSEQGVEDAAAVDRLCEGLFFGRRAQEQDDNLLFVRERLLRSEVEVAGLLHRFEQVLGGKKVEDDDTDPFVTILKLSGITRIEGRRLRVRNRIYERVFDRMWVATNMPDAEVRRQRAAYRKGLWRAAAIAAVILLAISSLAFVAVEQRNLARAAEAINRQQLYAAHMNLAMRDWQDLNINHMRDLLARQVPKAGQDDLRGFEWYLLWALAHPDRQTLHYSGSVYNYRAFSPDFRIFATGEKTNIQLWDLATGEPLSKIETTVDRKTVGFSPDGKLLAADSADGSIRLLDLTTGRELRRFQGHTKPLSTLVFSSDGKMLASSNDQTTRIWDIETGNLLATLKGHTRNVNWIAFSPDSRKVATASQDETVKVWDAASGRELMTLKEHRAKVQSNPANLTPHQIVRVAFSPDGKRILASGFFINIAVWDAATGEALPPLSGHQAYIFAIAFSPDGKLMATGSEDRTILLWDVSTWSVSKSFAGHSASISDLVFSPDNKSLASISGDRTVKLWDVASDPNPHKRTGASDVVYAPDGKHLASAFKETIKVWDTATWDAEVIQTPADLGIVTSLAYSPDGKLLASGHHDKTARLWDLASGKELFVLRGHTNNIYNVAFSPDGKLLATGSGDDTIRLWDMTTGEQRAKLEGHEGFVMGVAFSPDSRLLASASNDTSVKLWDVAAQRELFTLKHPAPVWDVAFSPDGKLLATANDDNSIKLWDVAAHKELSTLNTGRMYNLAFSPDGKRLASSGFDHIVRFWDVATGQELIALRRDADPVWSVAFSPDGQTLVSGSGTSGNLRVWRAASDEEVRARDGR